MRNMYQHPAYVPHGIMKIIPFWEYRYPRTFVGLGVGVALFLVAVGGILCALGYPWGVVLLIPAALRLWIAYQLMHFVQS